MDFEKRILKSVRKRVRDGVVQVALTRSGFPVRCLESLAVEALRRLGVPVETERAHGEPTPPTSFARHAAQDYQSLLMHLEAIRLLRDDPTLAARALETVTRWRETADPRTNPLFDQWSSIITKGEWDVAMALDENGNQLRQASPLAALRPEKTRVGIIRNVKALKDFDEVRDALGDLPVGAQVQFFFTPKGSLSSKTPLEALACGQVAAVKATAEAFADIR